MERKGKESHLIGSLRGLVNRDSSCDAHQIGLQTQILTKVDGVGAVEATGRVIPALKFGSAEGGLCNANALALATTDSAHKFVTHAGVEGVVDSKGGHHNVSHHVVGLLTGEATGTVAYRPASCSECQGLPNGKVSQMRIDVGVVENVSSKRGSKLLWVDTFRLINQGSLFYISGRKRSKTKIMWR